MPKKTITQPADWWFRWEMEAFKKGMHLSEWMGMCCNNHLPQEVKNALSDRVERGRPSSLMDMPGVGVDKAGPGGSWTAETQTKPD